MARSEGELDVADTIMATDRGIAYAGNKDNDRAIADYSEVIRIDPNYTVAYSNRGNL